MTTLSATVTLKVKRDRVVAGFEDLLAVDADLHDCLAGVGRDYASLRRTLIGAGRLDLVLTLKAMKEADAERLRYALGRQWQA
ncbi:hypothetical protein HOT29_gp014 [Microbacterium phage Squash]|uniref:Uncharacterized protein n=1 Tax=Microbacterium phage Squash TaxID=2182357 RepID=A0A2U8ULZ2_9CAUD|nr:hypothetical protein HOT29_gp014 [Microbacterium phage Squash]AWN04633.1 hypothetical protein PBI_SQUASH_14 [Microbacterium phage Squash]QIQ63598.1 hypothetical protein SEA_NIKE_13 [Microbacterium phage Nike]